MKIVVVVSCLFVFPFVVVGSGLPQTPTEDVFLGSTIVCLLLLLFL